MNLKGLQSEAISDFRSGPELCEDAFFGQLRSNDTFSWQHRHAFSHAASITSERDGSREIIRIA